MRLSEQTVSLLKNFSGINQNIQFKAGNKISTISAQKNILASAEIPESFPSDFAIYDLNKMLGVMSLFQDPDLEIGEKTMKIKKSDPARRKAFRARHNCDNPGPRHKARYWSCRKW